MKEHLMRNCLSLNCSEVIAEKMWWNDLGIIPRRPSSSKLPIIVCVFPQPVCPYANIVPTHRVNECLRCKKKHTIITLDNGFNLGKSNFIVNLLLYTVIIKHLVKAEGFHSVAVVWICNRDLGEFLVDVNDFLAGQFRLLLHKWSATNNHFYTLCCHYRLMR